MKINLHFHNVKTRIAILFSGILYAGHRMHMSALVFSFFSTKLLNLNYFKFGLTVLKDPGFW